MKLTDVEIYTENSDETILISFQDPKRINQYNVKDINGLDADEISAQFYGASQSYKYYNISLVKRDVIILIGLNPVFSNGETYSYLRDKIYKLIASSRSGKLQLYFKNNAEIVAKLSGFISKIESPKFDKTPEVKITIKCDNPMLISPDSIELVVMDLTPGNTIISDDKSTAPHGFKFAIGIDGPIASLAFRDPTDSWNFEITPIGGFLTGDILYFSSEYNKYLYYQRGAIQYQLADVIKPGSIWPILFPGDNIISCTNSTKIHWDAISYYSTYWGV